MVHLAIATIVLRAALFVALSTMVVASKGMIMTEQERIDAAYFMVEAAADVMGSTRKVTYWNMADRFKDGTYTTSDLDTYLFLLEKNGGPYA